MYFAAECMLSEKEHFAFCGEIAADIRSVHGKCSLTQKE